MLLIIGSYYVFHFKLWESDWNWATLSLSESWQVYLAESCFPKAGSAISCNLLPVSFLPNFPKDSFISTFSKFRCFALRLKKLCAYLHKEGYSYFTQLRLMSEYWCVHFFVIWLFHNFLQHVQWNSKLDPLIGCRCYSVNLWLANGWWMKEPKSPTIIPKMALIHIGDQLGFWTYQVTLQRVVHFYGFNGC